jgi:hypothetical protein
METLKPEIITIGEVVEIVEIFVGAEEVVVIIIMKIEQTYIKIYQHT